MINSAMGTADEIMTLEQAKESVAGRNCMAALTLCWVFGMWGGHQFYTGNTRNGWIMVVLNLIIIGLPVTYIWSVIDGFRIAFGGFTRGDGAPLVERNLFLSIVYAIFMLLAIFNTLSPIATIFTSVKPH